MNFLKACLLPMAVCLASPGQATKPSQWSIRSPDQLKRVDDDIARNSGFKDYFDGIEISEYRFRENGFNWHLIRYANRAKPDGPLWMVPHDDENAAFEAMTAAIREHGGIGIAVNSGPGSVRRQSGYGACGIRSDLVSACDPNRNFDARTPLFTSAVLSQRTANQPIIALHTNASGFSGDGEGGRGDITILDRARHQSGVNSPREGGIFAVNPKPELANFDTLGLTAYLAKDGKPDETAAKCGQAIANAGVHFWHERVRASDGSMSNYLAFNRPDIRYFNAESRAEIDLAVAAVRHKFMVAVYLANCVTSGNQPAP